MTNSATTPKVFLIGSVISKASTVAVNIHAVSALLKPALTASATVCSGAGVGSVCAKAAEEKDAKRKKVAWST